MRNEIVNGAEFLIITSVLVFLTYCSGGDAIVTAADTSVEVSDSMKKCLAMGSLWQIKCFCYGRDACEGSGGFPCFWDPADNGLKKNPEMADLYELFKKDRIKCRENMNLNDIPPCDERALAQALLRCEKRLEGK